MKTENILSLISRLILGIVFIFSGFVKGVDPMGSTYKFIDYFNAINLGFLEPFALVLAITLAAVEFIIGVSLLFRFRYHLAVWAVMVFMSFFTIITFILALTNPVSDCGCFGDAIILTNWQTFFKNLILIPFVLHIFWFRASGQDEFKLPFSWLALMVFTLVFLGIEFHACRHLPLLDFRPYSVGTYIPAKMSMPEGALQDEFKTFLYYEKNGTVEEFTEDNFPWEDTTWTYVDSKHILVKKGYEPPIHDFTIVDETNTDITSTLLSDEGYSFLLVAAHLGDADTYAMNYASRLAAWCGQAGHSFYCTTASGEQEIEKIRQTLDPAFGFHTTDEITLKTIVRANPGLLLLREGTILAKWHYRDFPELEEFENILPSLMTANRIASENRVLGFFIVLFLLISAGLHLFMPRGNRDK
ncbi:MAG: DoxX family protein [Bacteroidales bacterium]|nr:DoxX family protein [Bacteroidales bacterium]